MADAVALRRLDLPQQAVEVVAGETLPCTSPRITPICTGASDLVVVSPSPTW
ncbi:hypothetical protein [Nocardioides zeae]